MRPILILVVVLVALVAVVPPTMAQPSETFLIYTYNPYSLLEVDASGKVLKTLASFPTGTYIYGLTMAEDNQSYRVVGYQYLAPTYTGLVLDVPGVLGLLAGALSSGSRFVGRRT